MKKLLLIFLMASIAFAGGTTDSLRVIKGIKTKLLYVDSTATMDSLKCVTASISSLTPNYVPYQNTTGTLANGPIYTDGTNVAIGKTSVESWSSSAKALQIAGTGAIWGTSTETNANIYFTNNFYYDGTSFKPMYGAGSAYATMFGQKYNGVFEWCINSNLTADTAFTATIRMSLDPAGNLSPTGRVTATDFQASDSAISNTVVTKQLTVKAPFIPANNTVTRERIKITDSLTSSTEFKLTDIKTTTHKDLSGNYEWGDWTIEQYDAVKNRMDTTLAYEWDNDTREKFRFYSPVYFNAKAVASNEVFLDSTTFADSLLVRDITYTNSYWNDYPISISSGKISAANAPTWTVFGDSTSSYSFAINDYIDLETVDMSHGWKVGSSIYPHIHWATRSTQTGSGSVKWTLKYTIGGDNIIYKSGSISVEDTIANGTAAYVSQLAYFPEITMAGIPMGWVMKLRLYRGDAVNAEVTGNPFAGVVGLHYYIDSPGSRTMTTK